MPDYRRNRVPGGMYFFTVNLLDRGSRLLIDNIDALRDAVRGARARAPFHIDAWVVLPEHMHCVWTLPPADDDYSGRWRAVKKRFSKVIQPGERRSAVRRARGERGIWQRRFLGTYHSRRYGLRQSRGLCAFQSGQARICAAAGVVAVFLLPSGCCSGVVSLGLRLQGPA